MRGLLLALVASGAWAQDDFVVADGKIVSQTFAMYAAGRVHT